VARAHQRLVAERGERVRHDDRLERQAQLTEGRLEGGLEEIERDLGGGPRGAARRRRGAGRADRQPALDRLARVAGGGRTHLEDEGSGLWTILWGSLCAHCEKAV